MSDTASAGYSTELRRLAAVSSLATVLARHVTNLVQLRDVATPSWLTRLEVPPSWTVRQLADDRIAPSRIAVCGQQPDGTFDGCETISVFAFTGDSPESFVRNNADRTLRDLAATAITTQDVALPSSPDVVAVRSSGYFAVAGVWMWAQYSFYVYGTSEPHQGRLIEQAVFVDSASIARLNDGVVQLTQTLHVALGSRQEDG